MNHSSLSYDIFESPLGPLYLVFTGRFLSEVSFKRPSRVPFKKGAAPESFVKELESYFEGADVDFKQEVKLLSGTEFEREVWAALKKIPSGETRSYKWVAEQAGRPAAVRAVGRALSKNPVPIVIPCHRVIESDGSLGGYSSGVQRKRRLLEMEYYASVGKQLGKSGDREL